MMKSNLNLLNQCRIPTNGYVNPEFKEATHHIIMACAYLTKAQENKDI